MWSRRPATGTAKSVDLARNEMRRGMAQKTSAGVYQTVRVIEDENQRALRRHEFGAARLDAPEKQAQRDADDGLQEPPP